MSGVTTVSDEEGRKDVNADEKMDLANDSRRKNVLLSHFLHNGDQIKSEATSPSYQLFQSKYSNESASTENKKSNVNNRDKKFENNQKKIQSTDVSSTRNIVGHPLHYAPAEWNVKKTIEPELTEMFKKDDFTGSSYQAFNPKTFLNVLEEKARAFGLSPAAHKKSLLRLAFITVTKGNNLRKILAQDETSDLNIFFQEMKEIYELLDGKPKTPTDVTLPRVATVLSAQIALAIKNGTITTTIVDPKEIHEQFPQCMCFSEFGNLIPEQREFEHLFMAFCYHQFLFSAKINRNKIPNKSNILHYAKLQRSSDFYTTDEKINYLTTLNLITVRSHKIHPDVSNAIFHASQAFRAH